MAEVHVTTDAKDTATNSTWRPRRGSERVDADARPHGASDADIGQATDGASRDGDRCHVSPLEAAIEETRERLMLADSVLGCLQIAFDPRGRQGHTGALFSGSSGAGARVYQQKYSASGV